MPCPAARPTSHTDSLEHALVAVQSQAAQQLRLDLQWVTAVATQLRSLVEAAREVRGRTPVRPRPAQWGKLVTAPAEVSRRSVLTAQELRTAPERVALLPPPPLLWRPDPSDPHAARWQPLAPGQLPDETPQGVLSGCAATHARRMQGRVHGLSA
jgi:hypothetical protein